MPSTPPPLYLDPQIDQLLHDRTIHEFDILLNYAHTHGTYLLDDSQFRIFQITYETSKVLDTTLRKLYPSTEPQTINAAIQLHALLQTHSRQTRITYNNIVTPELKQRMNRERSPAEQIDSPPPMRIISPPKSPSPNPPVIPTASTSRPTHHPRRPRKQKLCYLCKQPSHQKRNCPKYQCQTCYHRAPGHLTLTCHNRPTSYSHDDDPQDYDQYYDYDPDNNLNGEQ
jgi:hypothetical protein